MTNGIDPIFFRGTCIEDEGNRGIAGVGAGGRVLRGEERISDIDGFDIVGGESAVSVGRGEEDNSGTLEPFVLLVVGCERAVSMGAGEGGNSGTLEPFVLFVVGCESAVSMGTGEGGNSGALEPFVVPEGEENRGMDGGGGGGRECGRRGGNSGKVDSNGASDDTCS